MNKEQLAILAAFAAAMQEFTDVWNSSDTSEEACIYTYGAASVLHLLAKQTTDISKSSEHAAKLLNQAAEQLGWPQTN